ncbi:MAG: hypothetical protein NZ108_05595, partial [Bacteroidia bacterium]|nr:hypothetical protein [Bacteroidia bacterium]
QGGSVVLSATPGMSSYLWDNGITANQQTIFSTITLRVTVTDVNGCKATSNPTNVTVNPNPNPIIQASGATSFCVGDSVILSVNGTYSSYLWNTGATSPTMTVAQTGTYFVQVTSTAGCSGTSNSQSVFVNPLPNITITPSGPTTFCSGDSVILQATTGFSAYSWTTGATTSAITVTTSGNYSVTVTVNGCSNTASQLVTVNPTPNPTISASGPTTFCSGGSVTLNTQPGFVSYAWSNGNTTQSISVNQSGSFTVTVSNGFCSATSTPIIVTVNPIPTISIIPNGPTTFCANSSIDLLALPNNYSNYTWSTGATTSSITVNTSGTYTVSVTQNGCVGTASQTITVLPIPNPTITASGPTTFCQGGSVVLSATSGFASYNWSNFASTQSITVAQSGTYTVSVSNGTCFGTSPPITVTVNPIPSVSITPSGSTTFCAGNSVTLHASQGYTDYSWNNGATTPSITVTNSGTYTVTVTENGCSGSASEVVTVNPGPNTAITPSGPTSFCVGGSVTLTAAPGLTYFWSNGSTSQSITVSQSGNYTVFLSNGTCSAVSSPVIVSVY